jgi:hypothetical protein
MDTDLNTFDPEQVFTICQDIYKSFGIDLKFPKARDVTKTYQYRYLTAICDKFIQWDLDLNEVKRFLAIAIGNSFKHKTIKKGLSALHQKNLLQISYEQLISSNNTLSQIDQTSQSVYLFLKQFCDEKSAYTILSKREGPRSNMVLTNLFQAGKINIEFLAINNLCRRIAMDAISKDLQDAMFLPTLGKLYVVNRDLSANNANFTNFKTIKEWGSLS